MRGLESYYMKRGHQTDRHLTSMTNSAQRAELVKIANTFTFADNENEVLKMIRLNRLKRSESLTAKEKHKA